MSSAFEGLPKTPNLKLNKPGYHNVADIEALNENADILDEEIQGIKNTFVKSVNGINAGDDGNVDLGIMPIAKGGTGQTTASGVRNALGLGNTTGALPIANGGTGANNASQACANIGALPTSGGTMTGAIAFDIDNQIEFDLSNIKKVTNNEYIRIVGGTDVTSAGIILCGKDCILDDYPNNGKGLFILDATSTEENTAPWFGNGTDVSRLIGSPNGSLLWNGKEIERVSEIGDNYIRYENGIQIIFSNCSYTSSSTNITFPKPFINDDYILNMTSLTNGYPIVISRTTTSFTFTGRKAGTSSDSVSVGSAFFYVAIGKWK